MGETWDIVFRDSTIFWVQVVLLPLVVIIGVLGNSLTIHILTRKKMRLPSQVYLTALTLSDLLFLLFSFSMTWKHYECMKSVQLYWKYIPFGLWITDASNSTSVWLTVAFTIERYVAICHPLLTKSRTFNAQRRAVFVATCVYISCSMLTTPTTSLEWGEAAPDSNTGVTQTYGIFNLENTDLVRKAWYRLIYRWFSAILFVFLPLLILIFGNFFLINAVRQSQKVRQNLISCYVHRRQAKRMRREDRITINLILIIIVFLICQLPTASILIYTSMHTAPKDSVEENVLLGLSNIFNLLVAVNAECNFILYTATSEKYRKSFFQLLGLDSIFQRWINRKHRVITVKGAQVITLEENIRVPQQDKIVVMVGGSDETKEAHVLFKLCQKKDLVITKTCTTCELITAESTSGSEPTPL